MWNNSTINPDITSYENSSSSLPFYSGFLFLLGSSFLYGSNYVPVKQFETGDGMFFQFILCLGIWLVGFVVNWFRGFPKFYALPMLGGFFWATGNVNSVPIIKAIGLSLGMLIWSVFGLVTGWATARFGLFGLEKNIPSNITLNYIGVALTAASTIFYLFVKSDTSRSKKAEEKKRAEAEVDASINGETEQHSGFIERQSLGTKRLIGCGMAIFAGLMYGQYNTPVLYTNQRYNKDGNYLDMLFNFYTGILLTSTGYFTIYCLIMKNNPKVYPKSILPGLISGIMWGGATFFYFMSTNVLNQATSFPIGSSGPPIFSALWGILLYKEIKGLRNFVILFAGFFCAILGSMLIGLSF